jgi:hypothetical protein
MFATIPYISKNMNGKRYTFIKHKELAIIYEESGPIITNYNALITHP